MSANSSAIRREAIMPEVGSAGLRQSGGYIFEQPDPQFNGRPWRMTIKRMTEGDPIIGSFMLAIELLIRNAAFQVEPADNSNMGKRAHRLVETSLDDLNVPFDAFLADAISFVPYGWSYFETVYKDRRGTNPSRYTDTQGNENAPPASKFNDGMIGWHKFAPRPQDTLLRWQFGPNQTLQGMIQVTWANWSPVLIPIERSLLFRSRHAKNNPEGVSMLRNAWRPWWMKRNIEQIEAMGVERDLNGYPVLYLPVEYLKAEVAAGAADPNNPDQDVDREALAFVESMRDLITNIKRDASEGAIIPQIIDPVTKVPLVKLELLHSGGTRSFDTGRIIDRYDHRIALSALADFILLGIEGRLGSFALSASKAELFTASINSIANSIASVFNTYAIPRLMDINGIDRKYAPTLAFGRIENPDLQFLGSFLKDASSAGMNIFPNASIEDALLEMAGLPIPTDAERAATDAAHKPPPTMPAQDGTTPAPDGTTPPTPPATPPATDPVSSGAKKKPAIRRGRPGTTPTPATGGA